MSFTVYTPPHWHAAESLPVMLLLHGAKDNELSFDKFSVGLYLDEKIANGELPRLIIVNPDGDLGFWENWHDGSRRYRDWVVKDLMPYVQKSYNTLSCPQHCSISGLSMGGHGALRFAEFHSDKFASFAAISGPIISPSNPPRMSLIQRLFIPFEKIWGKRHSSQSSFTGDMDPYKTWVNDGHLAKEPLLIAWGNNDYQTIIDSNRSFHEHLLANDRDHIAIEFDGAHKWKDWRHLIALSIKFHFTKDVNRTETFTEPLQLSFLN